MNPRSVLILLLRVLATAAVVVAIQAASATGATGTQSQTGHVVFVQTNEPTGNRILVYDVGGGGQLTSAGSYSTGGNGAVAAPGTESDSLASQGSLVYAPAHRLLIAVNAGSDSVSTFSVDGDQLKLKGVISSGGQFPASVGVHGRLVYVLNAGGAGALQGFRIGGGRLHPIPHSNRSLGLANADPPNFLTSPGQVGFAPDGRQLIVTAKASGTGRMIDVFQVDSNGRLSASPVVNQSATPVPFAFTFTPSGRLAVGEAGASTLTTYSLASDGTLTDPKSQPDNQTALCWILRVGAYYYVSNTGSNNLSAYTISTAGQPSLVGTDGIVARTQPGPIDLTSPSGTAFLYVQTGSGTIHEFQVNSDGTLTPIGLTTGLPAGMEGIAST
jgi:6-phosphogluconolactonase (cycloisomerase 2 family)